MDKYSVTTCLSCGKNTAVLLEYCGCHVCCECGNHNGLERCYCGWSLTSPGNGRSELVEMGETIEPENY